MHSLYEELIDGGEVKSLYPRQCVGIFPHRLSSSGLDRLQALFEGVVTAGPSNVGRIVAGVGIAHVVKMTG